MAPFTDDSNRKSANWVEQGLRSSGCFQQPIVGEFLPARVSGRPSSTTVVIADKNVVRYKRDRDGGGRDARLREVWGKSAGHSAKRILSSSSSRDVLQ